jgi:tripartite-type tricarboxylate transporter receptor subunit TctC
MIKKALAATASGLLAAVFAVPAVHAADAWPTRPIRLVVPYAAGGPTDVVARLIATKIGPVLGQTVVVENRGGAGGTIGVDNMVRSAPDGYTFALAAPGPLAGMQTLTQVPYSLEDIQYLTLVARIPSVIAVNAKSGYATLGDLIKAAKQAPNKLNYGSVGPGTTPHIGAELLKQEAGIDVLHVPYKGAPQVVTALMGNEVQLAVLDLTPVLPQLASGAVKVLAVAGSARAPQLPGIPTTAEAGYPAVLMETNYGIIAPKGTPADIAGKFRDAVVNALQTQELKDTFLKQGAVALTSTPDEYRQLMRQENSKWKRVVARGNIKID